MVCSECLPKFKKEVKVVTTRKLRFDEIKVESTPCATLRHTGSGIKRRTGLNNDIKILACALIARNIDLDILCGS